MRREVRDGWCILRTAGPRTLALTASLDKAGFDVWTPAHTITKRKGRARERVECPAPIVPTFVFARAAGIPDLIRAVSDPVSPHPSFSIFRHRDRIPVVSDRSLGALRDEEERQRRKHLKTTRRQIEPGTRICLTEGAFAGMTGIVERGNGKEAVVNFGHGFIVSIASYLIDPEDVARPAPVGRAA